MTSSSMSWDFEPVNDTRRTSFSSTLIGIALLLRRRKGAFCVCSRD
jgi:hypothetical protein